MSRDISGTLFSEEVSLAGDIYRKLLEEISSDGGAAKLIVAYAIPQGGVNASYRSQVIGVLFPKTIQIGVGESVPGILAKVPSDERLSVLFNEIKGYGGTEEYVLQRETAGLGENPNGPGTALVATYNLPPEVIAGISAGKQIFATGYVADNCVDIPAEVPLGFA